MFAFALCQDFFEKSFNAAALLKAKNTNYFHFVMEFFPYIWYYNMNDFAPEKTVAVF